MRNFKDLQVWQKSHQFTLEIYECSQTFPKAELYGLTSQIRRAASSIPTNLAEGSGRYSDKEFVRFCDIASGSASEVHYQLMLPSDLNYLTQQQFTGLEHNLIEIKRMLHGLARSIRARL